MSDNAALDRIVRSMTEDEAFWDRYPNGSHFIDATNPDQAKMVLQALLEGDHAVLVYPDGRELLFAPPSQSPVDGTETALDRERNEEQIWP